MLTTLIILLVETDQPCGQKPKHSSTIVLGRRRAALLLCRQPRGVSSEPNPAVRPRSTLPRRLGPFFFAFLTNSSRFGVIQSTVASARLATMRIWATRLTLTIAEHRLVRRQVRGPGATATAPPLSNSGQTVPLDCRGLILGKDISAILR